MYSKDLGMVIIMILEKQENHIPKLKMKVLKDFQTYPTPSLSRKNVLRYQVAHIVQVKFFSTTPTKVKEAFEAFMMH
jgi:hypothetical protein